MGNVDESSEKEETDNAPPSTQAVNTLALKPKGACWYCNAPLDNIRRFCNKTCAEDYRSEEATFNDVKD
ncbi:MAG TPA: hypothetical protein VIF82_17995 [Burkholderiaceae bacterium]|jgi:predicted amidophosphoribosyltransferase